MSSDEPVLESAEPVLEIEFAPRALHVAAHAVAIEARPWLSIEYADDDVSGPHIEWSHDALGAEGPEILAVLYAGYAAELQLGGVDEPTARAAAAADFAAADTHWPGHDRDAWIQAAAHFVHKQQGFIVGVACLLQINPPLVGGWASLKLLVQLLRGPAGTMRRSRLLAWQIEQADANGNTEGADLSRRSLPLLLLDYKT